MLRILAVQRSDDAQREYVLLQNHGSLKVSLRGHLLTNDRGLDDANAQNMYVFSEDAQIPAMAYVLLVTGTGKNGWYQDSDARPVYCVYWNKKQPVWSREEDAIHLLHVIHSNRPRPQGLVVNR